MTGAAGEQEELKADAVVVSTGSRPRVPDWAVPDGDRVLTTRQAYPPPELPEHLVVVGSGVTGVEFVHMFSSLGSKVSLIVSRQHVLPHKDAEVAAALEDELLRRGVHLFKGARAESLEQTGAGSGRPLRRRPGRARAATSCWRSARSPIRTTSASNEPGVEVDKWGYVTVNHHCETNVPHIYAAGDVSGKLPLSSVAAMQGRKVAEHIMGLHTLRTPPHRLRQSGVGHLHRARDRRRGPRRGGGICDRAAKSGSPRCPSAPQPARS